MSAQHHSRTPGTDVDGQVAHPGKSVRLWLRVAIFCTGFAALQLALPDWWHWAVDLSLPVLTPLLAAFRPRSGWTTATVLIALGSWLVMGELQGDSWLYAGLIGFLCYAHHAAASVAAVWFECDQMEPAVWRDWLSRQGAVLGVSALLATVIATLSGTDLALPAPGTALVFAAVCVAAAVMVAISFLFHRRPPSRGPDSEDTEP